jgi:alpha-N-acetylglucosaminidase
MTCLTGRGVFAGINLPLAFVGQEYIWAAVFKEYDLAFSDLYPFFTGPAFLPWYRMGNIRGWAGGDQNGMAEERWTQQRGQFQKQLLARMRGLGMTAVLSGFSGHIPKVFADKHPTAKIRRSPDWGRMPTDYNTEKIKRANYASVYMLDPHDALFSELGAKFYQKQADEWGTDHIYQTDTYNEMAPLQSDSAFLAASSGAVYGAMTASDPDSIWLMQGRSDRFALYSITLCHVIYLDWEGQCLSAAAAAAAAAATHRLALPREVLG